MAENETRRSYPMLPTSHWWALRKKFRQSLPGIVTDSYLATVLSMGANSARANVLPFLKTLGIIDQEGKPTQRAKLWREDDHYAEVCKAILSDVYPNELREAVSDPVTEKAKARSWFAQNTGVGEEAANRMVAMYTVLIEGDASKQPDDKKPTAKKASVKSSTTAKKAIAPTKSGVVQQTTNSGDGAGSGGDHGHRKGLSHGPEVNINLQIHISADASADQIEQIFASMSKHLYKNVS